MKQPKPIYRITLNDRDLTSTFAPRLIQLTLSECRGEEADMLDITLNDSDGRLAIPPRGAVLDVSIGWEETGLVQKGRFTVDEIEHSGAPDILSLRARSASMTKNMGERQEKSWHSVTIAGIVKTIAKKHKLKPAVGDILGKIAIPHIDQTHESDMAFLTRLAKRYDAVMTVKDDRLLFMPIGRGVTLSGKDLPAIYIERHSGDQHRYSIAERENYEGVRAYWHSGAKGKRKAVLVGGEANRNIKVLPESYATEAEARSSAASEYRRIKRGQAVMSYSLALGRPEIRPELPVIVKGFKPEIDETDWLVKRVSHTLSEGGLLTSIELETSDDPDSGRHRAKNGAPQPETPAATPIRTRPIVQAELDQVQAAWSAEMAKALELAAESVSLREQGDLIGAETKLAEGKRISDASVAKYSARFDSLTAELNSLPA